MKHDFFLKIPFAKLASTTKTQKQPFVSTTHIDNYNFEWIFSLCAPLSQKQWMSEALIVIL